MTPTEKKGDGGLLSTMVSMAMRSRTVLVGTEPEATTRVATTPVAIIDAQLDETLERPGMHATTLAALEAVVWALLVLRGRLHPRQEPHRDDLGPPGPSCQCVTCSGPRRTYQELKPLVGCTGSGVVSAHFEARVEAASRYPAPLAPEHRYPEGPPGALRFYREWVDLTRSRQDAPSSGETQP